MNVGISPSEALELLASYDLALVVIGLGLLAVALLPRLLHDKPFTVPIAMVALGMVAFALPLGLPAPDPVEERELVERIAELGVILSLMVAGLTIDRAPGLRAWSATWRLLAITMPLTVGAIALLGWWAGLAPAAAVLLGAVISPTDPVLGKDVETGAPLEGADERETEEHDLTSAGEEDEIRFGLSWKQGSTTAWRSRTPTWRSPWRSPGLLRAIGSGAGSRSTWRSRSWSRWCSAGPWAGRSDACCCESLPNRT